MTGPATALPAVRPVPGTFPGWLRAAWPGASGMLVVVTACWGLSFPLTKSWQNGTAGCAAGVAVAGLTLVALRNCLALLLFAACRPRLVWGPSRREHGTGLLLGLTNFLACAMQVLGLASTTPARAGFLASLSAAWVPLLTFLLFGRRV